MGPLSIQLVQAVRQAPVVFANALGGVITPPVFSMPVVHVGALDLFQARAQSRMMGAARFGQLGGFTPAETTALIRSAYRGGHEFCRIDDELPEMVPHGIAVPRASFLLPEGLRANAERLDRFARFMHQRILAEEISLETILAEDEEAVCQRLAPYALAALELEALDRVSLDLLLNEYLDVAERFEAYMAMYDQLVAAKEELEDVESGYDDDPMAKELSAVQDAAAKAAEALARAGELLVANGHVAEAAALRAFGQAVQTLLAAYEDEEVAAAAVPEPVPEPVARPVVAAAPAPPAAPVSDPLNAKVTRVFGDDAATFPEIVAGLTKDHTDVPVEVIRGIIAQMTGRASNQTATQVIRSGRKLIDGYKQRLIDIDRVIAEKVPEAFRDRVRDVIVGRVHGYYRNLERTYTGVGTLDPDAFIFQQFRREVLLHHIYAAWGALAAAK